MNPNYQTKRRQVEALHITAADEKTFDAIREFFGGPDQAIVREYTETGAVPVHLQVFAFNSEGPYYIRPGDWLVRVGDGPDQVRVESDEYFNQSYEPIYISRSLCDTNPKEGE